MIIDRLQRLLNESDYTPEMEEWFKERTKRHIGLVQKYAKMIEDGDSKFAGLAERAEAHDASKFEDPEYEPYVFVSWKYKCKDDGKPFEFDDMKDAMNDATLHHVKTNRHHPEFYDDKSEINTTDRDKSPSKMVDATAMTDMDIGEMVADWLAMSEEKGTSPIEWADKNVNVRWEFTPEQKKLIYDLIGKYEL